MAEMINPKCSSSNSSRSKKSKNEVVRSVVGQYLKQKGYVGSEKYRKSDLLLLQTKKQFLFNKMIEADLQSRNSFLYSNILCLNNNQHVVDIQFGKFSQFVESRSGFIRTELRRFYAPIICHLYLELIKAREEKAAVDFLKKYAHLVAPVESYETPLPTKVNGCAVSETLDQDETIANNPQLKFHKTSTDDDEDDTELDFFIKLLQIISTCTKIEMAEAIEEVRLFRSSQYELSTTDEVFNTLHEYLQSKGHVLILNIIYTWIYINIIDNEINQMNEDYLFNTLEEEEEDDDVNDDDVDEEMNDDSSVKGGSIEQQAEMKGSKRPLDDCEDVHGMEDEPETEMPPRGTARNVQLCLKNIREATQKLMKAQPIFPRFVKIAERSRGLTAAHLDDNECHLVAGFNNADIQLWQMNQHTTRGKHLYRSFADSICPWELNNTCGEEEDEIETDIKLREAGVNVEERVFKYFERKYEGNSINEYGGIYLRGHSRGITDVRFSAHYPLLLSVSLDGTMRCWRAENYSCAVVYRGHNYPIWCVSESPSGMYVATGSKDLTARLWSLEKDHPLITYVGHTQDVECIAFHPNGNYLATGSTDLSVRLWCVTSGKLVRVFSDCKLPVTSIAFSPDGKKLAAGGEESKVRIFDIAAGSQFTELKDHSATVTSMTWNNNGHLLVTACQDGSMRVWDLTKFNETSPDCPSTSSTSASTSAAAAATASTSASVAASASSGNRIMALTSTCDRLVRVMFSKYDILSCLGC